MTGFARADGHEDGVSWVFELKSVNSKSLDLRFRLPPGMESLELPLRASLSQRVKRGAVSVVLTVTRAASAGGLRVNRDALAQVVALARELVERGEAAPPRADGLLALRGVLDGGEEVEDEKQRERRQAKMLAAWEKALDGLGSMPRPRCRRTGSPRRRRCSSPRRIYARSSIAWRRISSRRRSFWRKVGRSVAALISSARSSIAKPIRYARNRPMWV